MRKPSWLCRNDGRSRQGDRRRAAHAVANAPSHTADGDLRTSVLPSAEADGAGNMFVAWQDCRLALSYWAERRISRMATLAQRLPGSRLERRESFRSDFS